ncbi:hypothetical protein ACFYKX_13700 [Cytobacillus sp. FJAT-54145]|uniref:DUF8042 domain-containing protein n=1 Tax=Cytobacillus spartinae TaxID=3299023 RepID=A0ABW6KBP0_9BACI
MKYSQLLETIKEAFQYISESFRNLQRTESDRLMTDMIHAFDKISDINEVFSGWFESDTTVMEILDRFEMLVTEIEFIVDLNGLETNRKIIEQLMPTFIIWKKDFMSEFEVYIES